MLLPMKRDHSEASQGALLNNGVSTPLCTHRLASDCPPLSLQGLSLSSQRLNGELGNRQIQPLEAPNNSHTAGSETPLYKALNALLQGHDLAPHMETLRQTYDSITPLIPYLKKTVSAHPEVLHTEDEWLAVLKDYPSLLQRVPDGFLTDAVYTQYVVSRETFDVLPATMAAERKRSICVRACQQRPEVFNQFPPEDMNAEFCASICTVDPFLLRKIPDQYKNAELYYEFCKKDPRVLSYLPEEYRSAELCARACAKEGNMISFVPALLQTPELCKIALQNNGLALPYVPERCLDDCPELYTIACQNNGRALQHVPERYLNDHPELYTIACQNNGLALKYVPESYLKKHPELCTLACQNKGMALQYVPESERSPELCHTAVANSGRALEYVPVDDRTPTICNTAFYAPDGRAALCFIPGPLRAQDMYEQSGPDYSSDELRAMPAHIDRQAIYRLMLAARGSRALRVIPREQRTPELCKKAFCRPGYNGAIEAVPVEHLTFGFFMAAIDDGHWDATLHTLAKDNLCTSEYQRMLALAVSRQATLQLQVLSCPVLSPADGSELIHFLATGQTSFLPPQKSNIGDLCCDKSPLDWTTHNSSATTLLTACYRNRAYQPPYRAEGKRLERYIATALEEFQGCQRLLAEKQPSLHEQGKLTGGRTIRIDEGDTVLCYKFQKENEALHTLVREGLIHQYRTEHHDSRLAQMISELPYDPAFLELDEQNWPADWRQWPDPPCIQTRPDQSRYINVYRYRAAASYHRYAHEKADNDVDPYRTPESGIVDACYDMGLMAGMGLALTSMLPAFHDTDSEREWAALHSLLGYTPAAALPGTFGAWNSVATQYPDISHGGIRDIGDYEPYGAIDSVQTRKDLSKYVQPTVVRHKLTLANTLCENVLAAVLVRSRLRQPSPDYHIDNATAVRDTMSFIETACRQFVIGMTGQSNSSDLLPALMQRTHDDFQIWLKRAAQEMVYWTAAQPAYESPDQPAFSATDSQWDHSRCYAMHLRHTGQLCTTLYPSQARKATKKYPEDFHNRGGHLNLGANNTTFPLISLMQGLTTLAAGLLAGHPGAQAPGESEEMMETE